MCICALSPIQVTGNPTLLPPASSWQPPTNPQRDWWSQSMQQILFIWRCHWDFARFLTREALWNTPRIGRTLSRILGILMGADIFEVISQMPVQAGLQPLRWSLRRLRCTCPPYCPLKLHSRSGTLSRRQLSQVQGPSYLQIPCMCTKDAGDPFVWSTMSSPFCYMRNKLIRADIRNKMQPSGA